jgi:hypothetical protein
MLSTGRLMQVDAGPPTGDSLHPRHRAKGIAWTL